MSVMEAVGNVLKAILCGIGLFVVCFIWVICEEEIKGWWKRK